MSKKSRRRNRKILGALAALGTGLALANRGKGMEMSNIEVDSGRGGDSSSAIARKKAMEPVYRDDIMRGGKGIQNMRKIPGIVVDKPIGSFPFLGLKKGGRVKKGFAKKKKQANKMRKK